QLDLRRLGKGSHRRGLVQRHRPGRVPLLVLNHATKNIDDQPPSSQRSPRIHRLDHVLTPATTERLQEFSFVRSVRLRADHHGPAKAGHYVQVESATKHRDPASTNGTKNSLRTLR